MRRAGTIPFGLPPFQGWVRRLILACAGIFVLQIILTRYAPGISPALGYFALIPQLVLTRGMVWQLVTYSFLHDPSNIWHLLLNMLTLWMVGSLEELEWGSRRFLELYFFSVIGAGLTTVVFAYAHIFGARPDSLTIGASGGILGLLVALAVLDGNREFMMLPFPFLIKVKYLVAIMVFVILIQTIQASPLSNVANVAHVGGLAFGFIWAKWVPRRGLGFEASERFYGLRNAWYRWKRKQASKKFEVYMRQHDTEGHFDKHGNYVPPDDDKTNGSGKWVN
jgi:membrane associated rhomboid family serine protease